MITELYKEIASKIQARANCQKVNNIEWFNRHSDNLHWIEENLLPHGSGIDSGCKIDLERSTENKIVITFGYHNMNENGFYCGWADYTLTVKPSLVNNFDLNISGKNTNDIKDYLCELFEFCLSDKRIVNYPA
jgi:hypothetical protein